MLNLMNRMTFALLTGGTCVCGISGRALAQRVPGRDLLELPIGAMAEPGALAVDAGDGFRNPASARLPTGARLRASVAALQSGSDQGVGAQLLAVGAALPERLRTAVALSVVRASVDGIVRTETDPQSIGGDVPYNTFVVSAVAARRAASHVTTGLALRWRTGQLDGERRGAVGLDAGVIADRLFGEDIRVGASSFLWRPGDEGTRETAATAAADARVLGDSTFGGRLGYSYSYTRRQGREGYGFASANVGPVEARGGVARTTAFGTASTRLRLAVGVRYARYVVGIAREDYPSGLAPSYQFLLSSTFP